MRPCTRGFTLVELVVAVSITTVVALSVAGVSISLSSAYASTSDYQQSIQTGRIATLRIQNLLNKAKLVTASSDGLLVIWADDANGDRKINLNEMAVLTCDLPACEIRQYRVVFPDSMDEATLAALNHEMSLASAMNASSVTNMLKTNTYSKLTVIATDVRDFKVETSPDPPNTVLMGIQITVGSGATSLTVRNAGKLRVNMTGYVGIADGQYVLSTSDL